MKKKLPFILFFVATAFVIWKLAPKEIVMTEVPEKKEVKRSVASTTQHKKIKKKVEIKEVTAPINQELQKENQIIEEKLLSYYQDVFSEEKVKVTLYYEKEVKIKEDKSSYKAKIYKVSFDRGKGNKSNFKALVDSKTGMILKTWNRTRYEFKQAVRLSGEGREFYSL